MITLTKFAASKIKTLLTEKKETGIRAGVQGGGCSGFTYKLEFDNTREGDRIIETHGVQLYVDPKSYLYLMGTEIDFIDNLNQSGFKFINPNAKRTCGCGESFSV
jgi:iron-sulfur cluster assembly protein